MTRTEERLKKFRNAGVEIFDEMPKGWKIIKHTLTEPRGYQWAYNGESMFAKDKQGNRLYKQALVKINE